MILNEPIRYGFEDKTINNILEISKLDGLIIEGIFTHFVAADEIDKEYTIQQVKKLCILLII